MAVRVPVALALCLLATACSNGDRLPAHTLGEVPRDTRGDPMFAAIRPPEPEPLVVPMPLEQTPTAAVTTIAVPSAPQPAGVAVMIPTDPSQLRPPAKPVSCRHLKRC